MNADEMMDEAATMLRDWRYCLEMMDDAETIATLDEMTSRIAQMTGKPESLVRIQVNIRANRLRAGLPN